MEQRRTSRIALARALAAQWFGQLVVVEDPADEWLLWGLQGYAVALFMHTAYGGCEVAYHRIRERDAVCAAQVHAVAAGTHVRCVSPSCGCRLGSPQLRMPFAYVLHLPMRVAASDSTRRRQPSHQFCLDTAAAAAVLCRSMQVAAGDSGLVPPLSWRNPCDAHLMTAERLQSIELLRQKASAVMHMLASKCGHDAFVSILRGLLQKALKARQQLEEQGKQDVQPAVQDASDVKPEQGTGKPSADSATKPRVLQTAGFMRQVANVCRPLAAEGLLLLRHMLCWHARAQYVPAYSLHIEQQSCSSLL